MKNLKGSVKWKLLAVLGVGLIVALAAGSVGCDTLFSTPTPAKPAAPVGVEERVGALEQQVARLNAEVASVSAPDTTSITNDLADLRGELSDLRVDLGTIEGMDLTELEDQLDDLEFRIAVLEGTAEEPYVTPETTIRWRFENPIIYDVLGAPLAPTGLELYVRPDGTIRDEGLYYIDLYIRNTDTVVAVVLPNFYNIRLTLKPSTSSDYALLSDTGTYIDTNDTPRVSTGVVPAYYPEPAWDADFVTATREGAKITRKVVFETGACPVTTIPAGGYVWIELVLELVYAD